jgi:FkbM family methyltransferase
MKYYSHPATRQDEWLLDVLGDKCNGTALEVGGYDGITHSNTLLVESLGWKCTLIEAVPEFFEKMVKNRPLAECLNYAIGGPLWGSNRAMYVNGQYSGLTSTMSPGCLKGHQLRNSKRIKVNTHQLDWVVKQRHFNYMSLDTEGNEEEILMGWFRAGGSCDALTVEFNYDSDKYYRLLHLCDEHGMELDRVQGFDMFFLRKAE